MMSLLTVQYTLKDFSEVKVHPVLRSDSKNLSLSGSVKPQSSNSALSTEILSLITQLPSFRDSNQLCVFSLTEPLSAWALTHWSTGGSPFT